jgi:hypothetical protein
LPPKGRLDFYENWRAVCLLDVAYKVFAAALVPNIHRVMEEKRVESQTSFRGIRGVIGGIDTTAMGLEKCKEHGLETCVLFIDLAKASDTVPRDALFKVIMPTLLSYGRPCSRATARSSLEPGETTNLARSAFMATSSASA